MVERRNHGEGGLHWEETRQRWVATVYTGFYPNGKRRKVKVTARTKNEAKLKLRALVRDLDAGKPVAPPKYMVREAVESWLEHGLANRNPSTVANRTSLARTHVIPSLGNRRLSELTADEIDAWLVYKSKTLSTDTLHRLLGILRQSIRRAAQSRDMVQRNVALLCDIPRGTSGRPSKSMTFVEASAHSKQRPDTRPSTLMSSCRCSLGRGQRSFERSPGTT